MVFARLSAIFAIALMLGCGGPNSQSTRVEPPPSPPATEKAKVILEEVANTGEVGSGTEELRPIFEEIGQTDAAKGQTLLSDLDKLQSSGSPSAAQAKAKEMLGKL